MTVTSKEERKRKKWPKLYQVCDLCVCVSGNGEPIARGDADVPPPEPRSTGGFAAWRCHLLNPGWSDFFKLAKVVFFSVFWRPLRMVDFAADRHCRMSGE